MQFCLQDCNYHSGKMICLSPNVSEIATTKNGKQRLFNFSTEIIMDGYKSDFKSIQVVPDPIFDQFPDGVLVVKTDDLILAVSVYKCFTNVYKCLMI